MHWYFKFVLPIVAAVLMGMGHAMTGGASVADIHEAKACKGFVVFNGERVPKCQR